MTQHQEILNFIAEIRNSHPEMITIFTYGSCLNFHLILRKVWPQAELYYNLDHVISKIGNYYYDITGTVNPEGFIKITDMYHKRRISRAFVHMYNYNCKL